MTACECYPSPEDHEDGCPVRLGETERVEYANRFTAWTNEDGVEKRVVKYDFTGSGDRGLREARRLVADTMAWQPHQDLPADAVVVFRPVSEWATLTEGEG